MVEAVEADIEAVDIVTVVHNPVNYAQSFELGRAITEAHPRDADWTFTRWDNRIGNLGFAKGCNLGARAGSAPIIGFLNPDVIIEGPFLSAVRYQLGDGHTVVTGSNFGKPASEYQRFWGCREWVCGAAFFVRRSWWEKLGGFDETFVWGWEETDFIRRTEAKDRRVHALPLRLHHDSPMTDSATDAAYKRKHFANGARAFYEKWPQ